MVNREGDSDDRFIVGDGEVAREPIRALSAVNAALRERQAVTTFLIVRAARAIQRCSALPWWCFGKRFLARWSATMSAETAKAIEEAQHHEDQARFITEITGGHLRVVSDSAEPESAAP